MLKPSNAVFSEMVLFSTCLVEWLSDKVWLGPIYIKDEGGYKIIFRALEHYIKRLKSIAKSPELSDSPMFVQIVQQEAGKTKPRIDAIINLIKEGLEDNKKILQIEKEKQLIEKALNCYDSDLKKAINNEHQYYKELVGTLDDKKTDIENISLALQKLRQYA